MKPQGNVALDILTEFLQQLYHCYNNVESDVQAKSISLQINLGLKAMSKIYEALLSENICNTFFDIILIDWRLLQNFNVDMRRLPVRP